MSVQRTGPTIAPGINSNFMIFAEIIKIAKSIHGGNAELLGNGNLCGWIMYADFEDKRHDYFWSWHSHEDRHTVFPTYEQARAHAELR